MSAVLDMSPSKALRAAERDLADLQAEQAGLVAAIAAARRAGDLSEHMRLTVRGEDLPVEIREARRRLLPLLIEHSWSIVEAAQLLDVELMERRDESAVALQQAKVIPPREFSHGMQAAAQERIEDLAAAGVRTQIAYLEQVRVNGEAMAGRQALRACLLAVELLEAEFEALGGDPAADGEGIRALPRIITRGFHVAELYDDYGALVVQVYGERSKFLAPGERPPRWVAYGMGEHFFTPVPTRPDGPALASMVPPSPLTVSKYSDPRLADVAIARGARNAALFAERGY